MTSKAVQIYRALRLKGPATVRTLSKLKPVELRKPSLWPSNGGKTSVAAAWNQDGLHALFSIYGSFKPPTGKDRDSILNDDRVEIFVFPPKSDSYNAYEVNRAGIAYDFRAKFVRQFDTSWRGKMITEFTAAADAKVDNKSDSDSKDDADSQFAGWMRMSIPWSDLNVTDSANLPSSLRLGFYRGETFKTADGKTDFIWTSWVDPNSKNVNFHCAETFGELQLSNDFAD